MSSVTDENNTYVITSKCYCLGILSIIFWNHYGSVTLGVSLEVQRAGLFFSVHLQINVDLNYLLSTITKIMLKYN